jgi:putative pyruvate formate lyase activating enzyme
MNQTTPRPEPLFDPSAYANCVLCPRACKADRTSDLLGYCGMGSEPVIALAALHEWEEPCISGTNGSGTVFFSGCSLQCRFCQNRDISIAKYGAVISTERLCEIFFELQEKGAHNINLVTAQHFLPHVVSALRLAKSSGLQIPVVWNTGGYESLSSLRALEGLVDIYLPDMKFISPRISGAMCGAPDYFSRCSDAIAEMFRQVGTPRLSDDGIMSRGVIVRHLMLPGYLFDTRKILLFLTKTYGNRIYISLMNQYTPPVPPVSGVPSSPLRRDHYDAMVNLLMENGQENAFVQEAGTDSEFYIPRFDLTGV